MVFLFKSQISAQNRNIRIRDLILMIVRVTILAALIFFLARPFEAQQRSEVEGEFTAEDKIYLIVLDNSYSMGYTISQSYLETALQMANNLLNQFESGSKAGLLLTNTSQLEHNLFFTDLDVLRRKIETTGLDDQVQNFKVRIDTVLNSFLQEERPIKKVFIISDFQEQDWYDISFPAGLDYYCYQIGRAEENKNMAISEVYYPRRVSFINDPIHLKVQLHNRGNVPSENIIQIIQDERVLAEKSIELASYEETLETFNIRLLQEGIINLTAMIPNDRYSYDNEYYFPVVIKNKLSVNVFCYNQEDFIQHALISSIASQDYVIRNMININLNPSQPIPSDFIVVYGVRSIPISTQAFLENHIKNYKPIFFLLDEEDTIADAKSLFRNLNIFRDITLIQRRSGEYRVGVDPNLNQESDWYDLISGNTSGALINSYIQMNYPQTNYLPLLSTQAANNPNHTVLIKNRYEWNAYLLTAALQVKNANLLLHQLFPLLMDKTMNRGIFDKHFRNLEIKVGSPYSNYIYLQGENKYLNHDEIKSLFEKQEDVFFFQSLDEINDLFEPKSDLIEAVEQKESLLSRILLYGLLFLLLLSFWTDPLLSMIKAKSTKK